MYSLRSKNLWKMLRLLCRFGIYFSKANRPHLYSLIVERDATTVLETLETGGCVPKADPDFYCSALVTGGVHTHGHMSGIVFSLLFRLRWPNFLATLCCYEKIAGKCCARKFFLASELNVSMHALFAARQRLAFAKCFTEAGADSPLSPLPRNSDGGGDLHTLVATRYYGLWQEAPQLRSVWPYLEDDGTMGDACTLRYKELSLHVSALLADVPAALAPEIQKMLLVFSRDVHRMVSDRLITHSRSRRADSLTETIYLLTNRGNTPRTFDTDPRYASLSATLHMLEKKQPRGLLHRSCNCVLACSGSGSNPFACLWDDCRLHLSNEFSD
jgi:hypothetical protein